MYSTTSVPKPKWGRKTIRARTVSCEIMSPGNTRNYTYQGKPKWLPKHDMNKNNTNKHVN